MTFRWNYYESIGGGMEAAAPGGGHSGVQIHMTNTLNTPIEVLETRYPLRVTRYALRRGSGGAGLRRGDDGLIREYQFLAPAQASLLTERRLHAPWGFRAAGAASRAAACSTASRWRERWRWNWGRETLSPQRRPGAGLRQSDGRTFCPFNRKGRSRSK